MHGARRDAQRHPVGHGVERAHDNGDASAHRGANRDDPRPHARADTNRLSSVVLGAGKMLSDFDLLRRICLD